MDAAIGLIEREGLSNVFARHLRIAARTRARASELGLELFPDERDASPAITALKAPAGVNGDEIRRVARDEFGVVFGGGQGKLKGKLIRIGHMGHVHEPDIDAMAALAAAARRTTPQLARA